MLIANPTLLPELIKRNAELTASATDARTLTDVNANNVRMATIVREQSKKLSSLVPLSPEAFMKALMKSFSAGEGVDWVSFGVNASAYFREPPTAHGLAHM